MIDVKHIERDLLCDPRNTLWGGTLGVMWGQKWVGVILGKNQLDYWILENPTNFKLEKWGCIPWIFYLLENVL